MSTKPVEPDKDVIGSVDELPMPEADDGGKADAPTLPSEADEVTGPEGDGGDDEPTTDTDMVKVEEDVDGGQS